MGLVEIAPRGRHSDRRSARPRRPGSLAALAAVALACGLAQPALAGVAGLEAGVLTYRAALHERNNVFVTLTPRQPAPGAAEIREEPQPVEDPPPPLPLSAGPGCASIDASQDPYEPRLPFVRCPFAPAPAAAPRLDVALLDGHDAGSFPAVLRGTVAGGGGDDSLRGAALLLGGPGADHLVAIGAGARMLGGPGNDQLLVSDTAAGARVSGGPGSDSLNAETTLRAVVLDGGLGADGLLAGEGADVLRGGPGDDYFEDYSHTRAGNVYVLGPGRDSVAWAGEGPDLIRARDGRYDDMYCSDGRDTVVLDALDFFDGECERVRRRGLARSLPLSATAYFEEIEDVAYANSLGLIVTCPFDGARPCTGTVVVRDRRGVVVRRGFHTRELGLAYPDFRLPRPTLRRLVEWARITIVSRDRRGALHRHSMAGSHIVQVADPDA